MVTYGNDQNMIRQSIVLNKCTNTRCKNTHFVEDHVTGDEICPVCATVQSQRIIDHSKEWRTFEDSTGVSKNRVSNEALLIDGSLATTTVSNISRKNKGKRIAKAHHKIMGEKTENSIEHMNEFDKLCDILQCDNQVKYKGKWFLKHLLENNYVKKNNRKESYVGSICAASKQFNKSYTIKILSQKFNLQSKNIAKVYFKLKNLLNLKFVTASKTVVHRYCHNLTHDARFKSAAEVIFTRTKTFSICGAKQTDTIAVSAIYFLLKEYNIPLSLKELARETLVSEASIRNCYLQMFNHRKRLITDEINKLMENLANKSLEKTI